MLNLRGYGRRSGTPRHSQFLRRGTRVHSAASAIKTDMIAAAAWRVVIVNIVNDAWIHVRYRAVVVHIAVIPIAAVVATARVSIAVIDAAIVPNMRSPIAAVP